MELQSSTKEPSDKGGATLAQPWHGSKTSCVSEKSNNDQFMTFQSRDPIINIPSDGKSPKAPSAGGGGHSHGIPVEHPTSYGETLMHLLKGNVGSGIFAMGDAIKNAGIVVGPVSILLLGFISTHCQHLLLTAARNLNQYTKLEVNPDFAETVELSFANGPPRLKPLAKSMKTIVNTFLCVTQIGFCCVYFVFISENIKQVLDYYGLPLDVHLHMAIIFLPILLTALIRNLKYLAPFSMVANGLMFLGIIIVLYYSAQDIPSIEDKPYVANFRTMPLFFGTAIYAFEGIGLVLPLQNEMKEPKQFAKKMGVLNVGMVIVTILYITVGMLGYVKYGADISGSVTLNLPKDEILAQSVKIIIPLGVLFTYALQLYIPVDIIWPSIHAKLGTVKYPVFAELAFRSSLVLLTFILAEAIPYLGLFISLVGAVSSAALALVIPCIVDLVSSMAFDCLTPFKVFKDGFLILIGVVGMVTGGYESISAIAKAFSSSDS